MAEERLIREVLDEAEVVRKLEHERNEIRAKLESLPAELTMLRAANPSRAWKAAIDAVMNILPR